MMKRVILLLVFVFILLLFSGTVLASSGGSFGLDWFRIGGSGGTMNGGTFSLVGILGQAEAGASSGGSYSLAGGFLGDAGEVMSSPGNDVFLPVIIKN
jgi:hypothetical protein